MSETTKVCAYCGVSDGMSPGGCYQNLDENGYGPHKFAAPAPVTEPQKRTLPVFVHPFSPVSADSSSCAKCGRERDDETANHSASPNWILDVFRPLPASEAQGLCDYGVDHSDAAQPSPPAPGERGETDGLDALLAWIAKWEKPDAPYPEREWMFAAQELRRIYEKAIATPVAERSAAK